MAKKTRSTSKTSAAPKSSRVTKKKTAKKKTTRGKAETAKSVDAILKKFAADRIQKENRLKAITKKQSDLESRVEKMKSEISKLKVETVNIEKELSELDQKRDGEIKSMLLDLGVNLGQASNKSNGSNGTGNKQPLFESTNDETPADKETEQASA